MILDKIDQEKENEDFSKDFMLDTVQEEIVRLLHLHIGDLPRVKVQKNKSIKYLRDRLIHCRRELDL